MTTLKIAVPGQVFQTTTNVTAGTTAQWSTTQIAITATVNAWTYAQVAATNIATITTTSGHGLTFTPAAGVLPNWFVTFQGNITGQTGVGTLLGPIFRILSIPSTTTFTIYSTVTAATAATTGAIVPVFIPVLSQIVGSVFASPQVTVAAGALQQGPLVASGFCNFILGPNCTVSADMGNISIIEDSTTGATLATAPTFRAIIAASAAGQVWLDGTGAMAMIASGTAGTSYVQVIE